jgi:hypothetical protein
VSRACDRPLNSPSRSFGSAQVLKGAPQNKIANVTREYALSIYHPRGNCGQIGPKFSLRDRKHGEGEVIYPFPLPKVLAPLGVNPQSFVNMRIVPGPFPGLATFSKLPTVWIPAVASPPPYATMTNQPVPCRSSSLPSRPTTSRKPGYDSFGCILRRPVAATRLLQATVQLLASASSRIPSVPLVAEPSIVAALPCAQGRRGDRIA